MAGQTKKTRGKGKGKVKEKDKRERTDSDTDNSDSEDVDYPAILIAGKDKIGRNAEGGKHKVRDAQADFEASMRGAHHQQRQKSIKTMKRFKLQKEATLEEFIELLCLRLKYSREVRSMELPPQKDGDPPDSSSVVTPPDCIDLYHMIELMDDKASILQLLFKQCNGYFQGFRPTPKLPKLRYDPDGFFIFSDVKLPPFFGITHRLHRTADYRCGDEVLVGEGFLGSMSDQMAEVTTKNFKNLLNYILETPMVAFGEAERLYIIEAFFGENFDAETPVPLTSELCFYYGNWSYLSKLALHIYLAIVEVLVGFHGSHATVRGAWDLLRKAIEQFERKGFKLVLTGEGGYFCLSKLIGGTGLLRLLKCEEGLVRKVIIRLHHRSRAKFREARSNSKGSCSTATCADSESDTDDEGDGDDNDEDDNDQAAGEEDIDEFVRKKVFRELADKEYARWTEIVADGKDLLEVLMHCPQELNCSHCRRRNSR